MWQQQGMLVSTHWDWIVIRFLQLRMLVALW
jgi:hypothetical protein